MGRLALAGPVKGGILTEKTEIETGSLNKEFSGPHRAKAFFVCGKVTSRDDNSKTTCILHHPNIATITIHVHISSFLSFTQYQDYTVNSIL